MLVKNAFQNQFILILLNFIRVTYGCAQDIFVACSGSHSRIFHLGQSFSGTAASLKSSPHQPFLSIVFPDFSYPIIFGFFFYKNNKKTLKWRRTNLHKCVYFRDIYHALQCTCTNIMNVCYIMERYHRMKILWQDFEFFIFPEIHLVLHSTVYF